MARSMKGVALAATVVRGNIPPRSTDSREGMTFSQWTATESEEREKVRRKKGDSTCI